MSKRKCTVLTLTKKLQVITDVQSGKSQRMASESLDVPKSIVQLVIFGSKEGKNQSSH